MNTRSTHNVVIASAELLEGRRLLAGIEGGVLVARGTEGADTISLRRTGADDVIVTTNGVNQQFDMDTFSGVRLEGLGGADTFNMIDALTSPVVRNTTVRGGAGNDTISYATRSAALSFRIDPADGTMTSGAQVDHFTGVETVIGGSGQDRYEYGNFLPVPPEQQGQEFSFRVEGRGANDVFSDEISVTGFENFAGITLLGGDGNDYFGDEANTDDVMFGNAGNDAFDKWENLAAVSGGSGTDHLAFFTSFEDTIDMRVAPDLENLSFTFDLVNLVIGNDLSNRIDLSGAQIDGIAIRGLGGNDTIVGTDGADVLEGGDGNDVISALAGNDSVVGGRGDDALDGGAGVDTVDGGPGNDSIVNAEVQPAAPNIGIVNRVLTADGSWGQDRITIERTGVDNVIVRVNEVSREFDIDDFDSVLLRGNAGYDEIRVLDPVRTSLITRQVRLLGGTGNDVLFGSEGGTESLDGGDGVDFLEVRDGFGGDTAIGGNGIDAAQVDPGDTTSGIENFD